MAGAPRVAVIVDTVGEASHLNPLPIDELMGDSLRQIAAVCNWRGGILGSGNRTLGTLPASSPAACPRSCLPKRASLRGYPIGVIMTVQAPSTQQSHG